MHDALKTAKTHPKAGCPLLPFTFRTVLNPMAASVGHCKDVAVKEFEILKATSTSLLNTPHLDGN